jgi:hypothetical protein
MKLDSVEVVVVTALQVTTLLLSETPPIELHRVASAVMNRPLSSVKSPPTLSCALFVNAFPVQKIRFVFPPLAPIRASKSCPAPVEISTKNAFALLLTGSAATTIFDKNIEAPLTFSAYPEIPTVVPILRHPDAVILNLSPKALEKASALDAGLRSVPPEDKEMNPTPEMELVFIFTLEIAE